MRDFPHECGTVDTYVSVLPRLLLQGAAPCPLFVTPCPFEKAEMTPCSTNALLF